MSHLYSNLDTLHAIVRIRECGKLLILPQSAVYQASVYFQRLLASGTTNVEWCGVREMQTASMLLVSKVHLLSVNLNTLMTFFYHGVVEENTSQFDSAKKFVLRTELALLRVIGFDFDLEMPYDHINSLADTFFSGFEARQAHAAKQVAWDLANDSLALLTPLGDLYDCWTVAICLLYMAVNAAENFQVLRRIDVWMKQRDIPTTVLKDIEKKLLFVYELHEEQASPN